MKQSRVTTISDGPANNSPASGEAAVENRDLLWVDEVAALLPEDLRLGWYRNVKPWISALPPEDEVAHLAYSMGYLALLIRNTPTLVAAERAKLAPMLQQLSNDVNDSLHSTAAYHQRLEEYLAKLPTEIADGINTAELAATITKEVRNQFSKSGLPETERLLNGQGERLQSLASGQVQTLTKLRGAIVGSASEARRAIEEVVGMARRAQGSIELWDCQMRWVQWLHRGLALLIGLLLGCLLYWSIWIPEQVGTLPHTPPAQRTEPTLSAAPKKPTHAQKRDGAYAKTRELE